MNTERQAHYTQGPRFFYNEEGRLMFEYRIDAGNVHGPRAATQADREKYPAELQACEEAPEGPPDDDPEGEGDEKPRSKTGQFVKRKHP